VVVALMAMAVLMTLCGALVVLTSTEVRIAASFRDGLEAFYAADAGIARAMVDLRATDWEEVRAGRSTSSAVAASFDLDRAGRDIEVVAGRGKWRPYAYGALTDLVPGARARPDLTVVVWVAADPAADDKLIVRSHAYAPGGVRRMVEVTVARTADGPRVLAWREAR
jgi:hypothetical protein